MIILIYRSSKYWQNSFFFVQRLQQLKAKYNWGGFLGHCQVLDKYVLFFDRFGHTRCCVFEDRVSECADVRQWLWREMGEVFLLSRSLAQDYSDYSGICAGYQLLCVSLARDNNPPSGARGPHLLCWLADARQNILQYIALHYFAVRGGLAFGTGSHSCPAQGFFIIRKWTTAAADPASDCFSWFLFFLLYDHDCTSPRNFSCVILRNNLIIPWFPDIRGFLWWISSI